MCGISSSNLKRIALREISNPSVETWNKIYESDREFFPCPPWHPDAAGIQREPVHPEGSGDEDFDFVPMAEAHLSAGGGAFVFSESFKDLYAFRKDWLKRIATGKNNLVLMRIIGDSMEPTIKDGDMVMIDRGRTRILSGMIYAIGVGDTINIKRAIGVGDTINIKRIEALSAETIRIISDNKADYPPYEKPVDQIRILGQVIWSARQYVREE